MYSLRTYALCVLSVIALSAPIAAQGKIIVGTIQANQANPVSYSNPMRDGQIVFVQATGHNGETQPIEIQLDGSGKGTANWTPPSHWISVTFWYPDADDVYRTIHQPFAARNLRIASLTSDKNSPSISRRTNIKQRQPRTLA